jgi:hypothetical protein
MADTKRILTALQALLHDNDNYEITAQDVRDFLVSVYGNWASKTITFADSPYAVTADDVSLMIDASGGPVVVDLPTGADQDGKVLFVKKIDTTTNLVTINRGGSDTIENLLTKYLTLPYDGLLLVKNGANWASILATSVSSPNTLRVDILGSDIGGDGTMFHPYRTIVHACSTILDS